MDRSARNELLKVNFNISFPSLSCEFATVDVSDALGTKRLNLTKTIRKTPVNLDLEHQGQTFEDVNRPAPKYDEKGTVAVPDSVPGDDNKPLNRATFMTTLNRYPVVVINFYAPWCHWCQRLEPTWEKARQEVHTRWPPSDGRIHFAKVDCTQEMDLCREHYITGFPSLRVFRKGHDDIYILGHHEHEAYTGDRTKEALLTFAEQLAASAGQPKKEHAQLTKAPRVSGCNLAGFVLVKKVPGTLHFTAHGEGHSFGHAWMNMTHAIHGLHFGTRPTPRKYQLLKKLHPAGLDAQWLDKLQGQLMMSSEPSHTHEHYLQVVMTTVEPAGGNARNVLGSLYDAYEYTAHSHTYASDTNPTAKFTYDLSPIQIIVREGQRHWYHFLTTTCAIVGGVFTVAGILDAILYQSFKLAKKIDLGKQT